MKSLTSKSAKAVSKPVQTVSKQRPSLSKHPIFISKQAENVLESRANYSMAASKLSDQLVSL